MNQKILVNFLAFWVANSVALLVLAVILPGNVVLGNDKITTPMAAVLAGLVLTVVQSLVPSAVAKSGLAIKNQNLWPAIYLVVNFVVIWVIKRLAEVTGVGISNLLFVLVAAAIVTVAGWGAAQLTGAMGKK